MAWRGKFKPQNRHKYKGDPDNIIYRSSWEFVVMKYLDRTPQVIAWSSEEIIIPYTDPLTGKYRRYFPDFWVKIQKKDDSFQEFILEVKPLKQASIPEKKSRVTKRYITEVYTYGINQAKWQAAHNFCNKRNWKFKIITENDLPFFKFKSE